MSDAGDEPGENEGADTRGTEPGTSGPESGADRPGSSADPDEETGGSNAARGGVGRLNQYFDALAGERRRYVLYYLSRHGAASVDELARYVVAREAGRSPDSLTEGATGRVASELYHKHLPRLADYGLVEFDPRSEHVRFREPTRTFSTLLWLSRLVEGE